MTNPLFRMNDHGDSWTEPELELETAHGYRVHVRPGDTLEHVATEALADFAELAAAVDPWSIDYGGAFDGFSVTSDADPGL